MATAFLGFSPEPWVLLALSLIADAGTGLIIPGQQAAVADIVGEGRNGGSVVSTFQMSRDLGGILGPLLAGFLVDYLDYAWAFGITGLIMLVRAAAWTAVPETLPSKSDTDH